MVQTRRRKPKCDLQEEVIWAEALTAIAQAASTAAMERRRRLTRADNFPAEYARVEKRWEQAARERDRQQARLREFAQEKGRDRRRPTRVRLLLAGANRDCVISTIV